VKNLWPKIGEVLSALIALYFLFTLVLLLPHTRFAGFKSNLLYSVAGFVVSALIFAGCVVAWRKGALGRATRA